MFEFKPKITRIGTIRHRWSSEIGTKFSELFFIELGTHIPKRVPGFPKCVPCFLMGYPLCKTSILLKNGLPSSPYGVPSVWNGVRGCQNGVTCFQVGVLDFLKKGPENRIPFLGNWELHFGNRVPH